MKDSEKNQLHEITDEEIERALSNLFDGKTDEDRKAEDMRHAINEVFKASESLREALDTLDLSGYEDEEGHCERLEALQAEAERIAQRLQRKAKEAGQL